MKTQADIAVEQRRLALLQALKADPDYSINTVTLHSCLKIMGHGVALSVVEGDAAWLEAQGLISVQDLPGCKVCKLRLQGMDVVDGALAYPGIARPLPES